jgi:hypothetical protein
MSIEELITVPEDDEWYYFTAQDGPIGYSSSSFVVALYRAAELFEEEIVINAMEFTVKDLYELDFYDIQGKLLRPQQCQEADPHVVYCQLTGQYRMQLPTLSTVKPYSRMNERCPSVPPHYERP